MVFKMNYLTSDMNTETAWIAHKDNDLTSRDFIRKRQWLLMSISTDSHLDIHNDIIQEELGIKGRKRSLRDHTSPHSSPVARTLISEAQFYLEHGTTHCFVAWQLKAELCHIDSESANKRIIPRSHYQHQNPHPFPPRKSLLVSPLGSFK